MLYFKNNRGEVFAYETQQDRDDFGTIDLVEMTQEEVHAHCNKVVLPTVAQLHSQVDAAADSARRAVAGDPLRAVEYDRARLEAEQYASNGYSGDVPPMVAAWAINGRTAQQAADSILHEAAQYTNALIYLRTVRLRAKEDIRNAMQSGDTALAVSIATSTIAEISAAVDGVGNN